MNKPIDLYTNMDDDAFEPSIDKSGQVEKETEDINVRLDSEISILILRQKEIQFYITGLNNANKSYNDDIAIESKKAQPNYKAIHLCKLSIKENLELISTFYKVYQQLEETKSKYYSQISNNKFNKHKLLLEIQLKLKSGLGDQDPFTILANFVKNNQLQLQEEHNLITTNYSQFNDNNEIDDDDINKKQLDSSFCDFTEEDFKL